MHKRLEQSPLITATCMIGEREMAMEPGKGDPRGPVIKDQCQAPANLSTDKGPLRYHTSVVVFDFSGVVSSLNAYTSVSAVKTMTSKLFTVVIINLCQYC